MIAIAGAATALAAVGCAASASPGGSAAPDDHPSSAAVSHSLSPRPVSHQPGRPTAEVVPQSAGPVEVLADAGGQAANGPSADLPPVVQLPATSARTLVHDFDALPVLAAGNRRCPAGGRYDTVTFTGQGHRWVATIRGCRGVAVSFDGHVLPALAPSLAFAQDLHRAIRPGPNLALIPPAR